MTEKNPKIDPHREKCLELIQTLLEMPATSILLEADLSKLDLDSNLEELGILPVIECPNPFDPELEEEEHEKWWSEHEEEGEKFSSAIEERELVMKYITIGCILAGFYNVFPRDSRESPKKKTLINYDKGDHLH
jgi:hypothetical protein